MLVMMFEYVFINTEMSEMHSTVQDSVLKQQTCWHIQDTSTGNASTHSFKPFRNKDLSTQSTGFFVLVSQMMTEIRDFVSKCSTCKFQWKQQKKQLTTKTSHTRSVLIETWNHFFHSEDWGLHVISYCEFLLIGSALRYLSTIRNSISLVTERQILLLLKTALSSKWQNFTVLHMIGNSSIILRPHIQLEDRCINCENWREHGPQS